MCIRDSTTAVPSGSNYTLSSVRMGKTVLTEGADYTYANNTLTIKATDLSLIHI